jgi:glycerophosphoryl diester phosphodiesterase
VAGSLVVRTFGASQQNATGNTTTAVVVVPSDAIVGDTAYIFLEANPATGMPTSGLTGWTMLGTELTLSASMHSQVYKKTIASGDIGATVTITFGASPQRKYACVIVVASDGTENIVSDITASGTTTANNPTTTASENTTAIAVFLERSSTPSTSVTAPTGYTLLAIPALGTGSGAGSGAVAIANSDTTAGSSNSNNTWTVSTNAGQIRYALLPGLPAAGFTGSASLSGSGTLSAVGTPAIPGTAALSGSGTLSATGSTVAQATLSGSGTLSAAGTPAEAGTAALSGSGTLTAGATPIDLLSTINWSNTVWASHRGGDPGPEETIAAYNATAPYTTFLHEMDLQQSSNGTMWLSHDTTIDRMASASSPITTGAIASLTDTQLSTVTLHINSGFSGADQPMAKFLDWIAAWGNKRIGMPEVKDSAGTSAAAVVSMVKLYGLQKSVIVQTDNTTDATTVAAGGLETCLLDAVTGYSTIASTGVKHIALSLATVNATPSLIAGIHTAGMKAWVYLVNNTSDRDAMLALGVDAMFSNKPWSLAGAQGTAALSGSGTLTATGKPAEAGTAALSGSGTLTAAGTPHWTAAAGLSGSGTLTATGTPATSTTAALSGSGTLTASGTTGGSFPASFSGSGTLTATGAPSFTGAAAFSGSGTLTATNTPHLTVSASLSGVGTLTAVGTGSTGGALSGTGTLTVAGVPRFAMAAALSGVGVLTASSNIPVVSPPPPKRTATASGGLRTVLASSSTRVSEAL